MKIGDIVFLNSGGPPLIVMEINEDSTLQEVHVAWHIDKDVWAKAWFPITSLHEQRIQ